MQCPSCGFENMPGQEECARCRAQLVAAPSAPGPLSPPRAGRWRRLRPIGNRLNRMFDWLPRGMPERLARIFRGEPALPGESLAAMVLSVVPGLGHLLSGRRRAALVVFGVWLAAAVLAVNFYHGVTGSWLIACLVGWHAGAAFDAGRAADVTRRLAARLRLMAVLLLVSTATYVTIDRVCTRYVDLAASPFAVRSLGMRQGDVLLVRLGPHEWRRGDVCVASGRGDYRAGIGRHAYVDFHVQGRMVAMIVALSGDKVEVSSEGVQVNGSPVARDTLPAGNIPMPETPIVLTVPEGHVLAVTPVGDLTRGNRAPNVVAMIWRRLYDLPESNIAGRASGIYLPLSRRRSF